MTKYKVILSSVALIALIVGITGCGSDNDNESDGGAEVKILSIEQDILRVGTASVVSVEFSFSSDDVFDDNRDVDVVVHLPSTLNYRLGSGDLKRPIDDNSVDPSITVCANGDSYLSFNLGGSELFDATNPDGDADAELRLTVDAVRSGTGFPLDASAQNDGVPFDCTGGMIVQQQILVDVVS